MSTGKIVALLMLLGGGAVIFSLMGSAVNTPIMYLGLSFFVVAIVIFIKAIKRL
jgi:hypothetical protein